MAENAVGPMPVSAAAGASFGVIITNRDRAGPLYACLGSLAGQRLRPRWVVLSDLGSGPPHRAELIALADRYQVSYLRIEHGGPWNKSLAFNTAFRAALRSLPEASHAIQLDADMILHPHLLARAAAELRTVAAFCCTPRPAPPWLEPWPVPGDPAGFEAMLKHCGPVVLARAVGVFMALPCGWLAAQRGFDEAYTGWGHEDSELWWRVRQFLSCRKDITGTMLIHQWHPRQPGAGQQGPNWPRYVHRVANSGEVANPSGWGRGPVTEERLRAGIAAPAALHSGAAAAAARHTPDNGAGT